MKKILRHFTIDTYSLWLTSQVAKGLVFENGIKTLIIAGIAVTLVSVFAKPLINILLLPLNLITFGIFRWVASAIILYLATLIVEGFKISDFIFSGFSSVWIDIPKISLHGILAFVAFSFILSTITSFIYWIVK